jgi:hypothetical protein
MAETVAKGEEDVRARNPRKDVGAVAAEVSSREVAQA